MKIALHPEVASQSRYRCNRCARGCRTFLVPLRQGEREEIEALEDWRKTLGVEELFVHHKAAGKQGIGLAKHADGRCVFLGSDNLCEIHRRHGHQTKPFACRLYPFVLTPVAGKMRVGLRFDCPAVAQNEGEALSDYHKGLKSLAGELMAAAGAQVISSVPELTRGVQVSPDRFETINESLMKMVTSDVLPLSQRLHWMRMFLDTLSRIKWQDVPDEDFKNMITILNGELLAQIENQPLKRQKPAPRARKLLGQIFFVLCQSSTVVTTSRERLAEKMKKRMKDARAVRHLSRITGQLPKIHADWPDCDLAQLEESFGPWPEDVEQMITRYLICRIGGVGYCGPNFYHYSLVEGARSLLLAVVTIGWMMRIEAVKAGRKSVTLSDAHVAVMTIDSHLGYSTALSVGPARMRLQFLSEHLEDLINWYCT